MVRSNATAARVVASIVRLRCSSMSAVRDQSTIAAASMAWRGSSPRLKPVTAVCSSLGVRSVTVGPALPGVEGVVPGLEAGEVVGDGVPSLEQVVGVDALANLLDNSPSSPIGGRRRLGSAAGGGVLGLGCDEFDIGATELIAGVALVPEPGRLDGALSFPVLDPGRLHTSVSVGDSIPERCMGGVGDGQLIGGDGEALLESLAVLAAAPSWACLASLSCRAVSARRPSNQTGVSHRTLRSRPAAGCRLLSTGDERTLRGEGTALGDGGDVGAIGGDDPFENVAGFAHVVGVGDDVDAVVVAAAGHRHVQAATGGRRPGQGDRRRSRWRTGSRIRWPRTRAAHAPRRTRPAGSPCWSR